MGEWVGGWCWGGQLLEGRAMRRRAVRRAGSAAGDVQGARCEVRASGVCFMSDGPLGMCEGRVLGGQGGRDALSQGVKASGRQVVKSSKVARPRAGPTAGCGSLLLILLPPCMYGTRTPLGPCTAVAAPAASSQRPSQKRSTLDAGLPVQLRGPEQRQPEAAGSTCWSSGNRPRIKPLTAPLLICCPGPCHGAFGASPLPAYLWFHTTAPGPARPADSQPVWCALARARAPWSPSASRRDGLPSSSSHCYTTTCLSVPPACLSVCPPVCLPVCLSVCLSARPPTRLPAHLSTCPSSLHPPPRPPPTARRHAHECCRRLPGGADQEHTSFRRRRTLARPPNCRRRPPGSALPPIPAAAGHTFRLPQRRLTLACQCHRPSETVTDAATTAAHRIPSRPNKNTPPSALVPAIDRRSACATLLHTRPPALCAFGPESDTPAPIPALLLAHFPTDPLLTRDACSGHPQLQACGEQPSS